MRLRGPSLSNRGLNDTSPGEPAGPIADALVLGGGPAGTAAALVLAEAGHSVWLAAPDEPPGGSLGESIPPSARALLADLGLLEAMDRAGFVPNRGNSVRWAGGPPRSEDFPSGAHGYHVDRAGFEGVLGGVLDARGVRRAKGFSARDAEREGDLWRVRLLDRSGRESIARVPWVIDATGRHGFFARRMGRIPDRRTTTVALVGRRARDPEARERGHTVIESHDQGWNWSLPVAAGVRCVTAMVDPEHTPLEGRSVDEVLATELSRTPLVDDRAGGWRALPGAWACPASLYVCTRYAQDGVVLAGDSGAFIDPLSSYGVKKALASGRLAGIAISTALETPDLASTALDFHDAHERDVAARYRAHSARYFEEAGARYGHPFWSDRAEAAHVAASEAGAAPSVAGAAAERPSHDADPDPDPLRPAAATLDVSAAAAREAYERIRSAPDLHARPGSSLRRISAPALKGRRIVMEDHLVSDRHPRPVRYHRSVDLRRLVSLAQEQADVPGAWTAYNRSGPPADLPEFLAALAVASAAGFLDVEGA